MMIILQMAPLYYLIIYNVNEQNVQRHKPVFDAFARPDRSNIHEVYKLLYLSASRYLQTLDRIILYSDDG